MSAMNAKDTILANKYQQKTDKQHILDNPDTYIGSVEHIESVQWILNEEGNKIVEKNIAYIPALFKLFDEGIVNCRDHVIRMQQAEHNSIPNSLPVTYIDISIQDDGTITMTNDGNGIDIAQHPEYNIWIPELIFGHLRTSTNYDKTEKKIVGGKNGFGFKLVLIWSTYGYIETIDHVRGLKYTQEFRNNLDVIEKPSITKCKSKPYTKIVFKPDYARLGIPGLTPDVIALLRKRVFDVAAVTDKSLKVKYNSQIIPVKNFQQYIDMYVGGKDAVPRVYEEAGPRWEYAVALSPTHEFIHVSFVNGIHTAKGGKHVEFVLNQITRKLVAYIEKKKKVVVNANSIKEQLILFMRCDIENPSFDSQTKDFMNTPSAKFGSTCAVSDKFIEKLAKMGVMDAACALTEVKENKAAKKTDGTKSKNVRGIPKLIDANWAGTEKSSQCIIIFCEGDSAKAGIVSGLSSEDRNTIGVYPMKGKILNVRGELVKKIAENKEIAEIKKILGLETGKEYASINDVNKSLRYGRVLFMTDQDLDGSHIKGLCINLFQSEWPTLSHIPGFIGFMNTPILKARKGAQEMIFYSEGEYQSPWTH
jgi:DNA topoisomerase-2